MYWLGIYENTYNQTYLSNQNTKLVKYNFVSIFQILAQWGITTALVPFAKHDSNNIKELVARVLNAVCGHAELRGYVVQQGGSKALVIIFIFWKFREIKCFMLQFYEKKFI